MNSTPPDPLLQILKSRPDWASGVGSTAGRNKLRVLWVAAAIMNTLGLPVGWMALFGGRDLPVYLQVMLPAFTLLGLHILFVAVRDSFRWRRFGRLEMRLDPLPGSIGGHVGGSLELPLHQATAADFRVLLMCIRDRVVKTKDGSSRSESVEWGKETLPEVERSGRGVRLRYTFEVPEGLPPSEEPSDDYHKWVVRVQADVTGPDLDQVFEVPALLMDPPIRGPKAGVVGGHGCRCPCVVAPGRTGAQGPRRTDSFLPSWPRGRWRAHAADLRHCVRGRGCVRVR